MNNIFNDDFRDFIAALNKAEVEHLLVGGYAVILHGYNRTTGDLDIWVNKTKDNYKKLLQAFSIFQMPVFDMSEERFLSNNNDVFTFGKRPVEIDLITDLKGISFSEAYPNCKLIAHNGLNIHLIHLNDLVLAKKASGRLRDIDDIEHLTL